MTQYICLTYYDNHPPGYGATAHLESGGFIRSRPHVTHPDIQFHFLPSQVIDHGRVASRIEAYQVCVACVYQTMAAFCPGGKYNGGLIRIIILTWVCVAVIRMYEYAAILMYKEMCVSVFWLFSHCEFQGTDCWIF